MKQNSTDSECPDWTKLTSRKWVDLLIRQPQLADKCDWSKLGGGDWASLLAKQPLFADKCDWEKLYSCSPEIVPYWWQDEISWEDDPDFTLDQYQLFCWASLLATQPQFACKCDWGRLSGKEWSMLLRRLPQYADKCDWGKLYEQATVKVEFECGGCCGECEDCGNQADCRRGYYEEPFDCWRVLLLAQPQFADRCDWARLSMTDMEWTRLLSSRPQLANYLTGEAWTLVITKNPDMANSSNLVKLSGKDWAVLLARRPEFADKCPYEKLSFPEIVRLFVSAHEAIKPHFDVDECFSQAKESDWDALPCDEWIQLLERHPKYADKCDFERFSGEETMRLLLSMPQFAKHCCIGKLYEEIGEGDDRHVRFAELLVNGTKNAFGGKRFHQYARLSEIKSLCDWSRLSCQDLKWIMRRTLDFEYTYVAYTTRLFKPQGSLLNRARNAPRISKTREIRIVKNANLDWNDLSGLDIVKLLKTFPQLSGQCNLSLLTVEDWVDLLEVQPTLAEKCKHLEKQIADERLHRDERLRRDEEEQWRTFRIREEAREERMERLFETECGDPEYAEMEYWNTH